MSDKTVEQYIAEIRAEGKAGAWTAVPVHLVSELIVTAGIDQWWDAETGMDKITKVTTSVIHQDVTIEGPLSVCAYDFDKKVLVR